MKWQFVIFCLCLVQGSLCTEKVDVKGIINDEKLREETYKCLVDEGPCTDPDVRYIRENIHDLYHDYCQRCTPKQAKMYLVSVLWGAFHEPEKLKKVIATIKQDWDKKGFPSNKKIA